MRSISTAIVFGFLLISSGVLAQKKEARSLNMPWEEEYGYAQALKVGDMVWISGQLGHSEDGVLAVGMEAQMRQTYANILKLLKEYDMTAEHIVEEIIYAMDGVQAFQARKKIGREFYPDPMKVTSTLIGVTALALPNQVVEIKITALKKVK